MFKDFFIHNLLYIYWNVYIFFTFNRFIVIYFTSVVASLSEISFHYKGKYLMHGRVSFWYDFDACYLLYRRNRTGDIYKFLCNYSLHTSLSALCGLHPLGSSSCSLLGSVPFTSWVSISLPFSPEHRLLSEAFSAHQPGDRIMPAWSLTPARHTQPPLVISPHLSSCH